MSAEGIRPSLAHGVMELAIHRPAKRNALTAELYRQLAEALQRASEDAAVRALLVHGEPDVFTSGNDIVDFLEQPPSGTSDPVFHFLERLIAAEKAIVAGVNGAAVGIGTTMLLHCDYVVAGEGSHFALPFVNLGLCPEAGSSLTLPAALGYRRAAELLLFGERIDAARALDWGLVNLVVPDARVLEVARARARTLAAKPAQALLASKALLRRRLAPLAHEAMLDEGGEFARLLRTPAAREALAAFVEKRSPDPAKVL